MNTLAPLLRERKHELERRLESAPFAEANRIRREIRACDVLLESPDGRKRWPKIEVMRAVKMELV